MSVNNSPTSKKRLLEDDVEPAGNRNDRPAGASADPHNDDAPLLTLIQRNRAPTLTQNTLELALYAYPPFYGNPLKVAFALVEKATYARAYWHFRKDHSKTLNVLGHLFPCLPLQLIGNFAFLAECDRLLHLRRLGATASDDMMGLGARGLLRQSTFFLWSAFVGLAPNLVKDEHKNCPEHAPHMFPRLVAIWCLFVTSRPAVTGLFNDNWRQMLWFVPALEVAVITLHLRKRGTLMREAAARGIPHTPQPKFPLAVIVKATLAGAARVALIHGCLKLKAAISPGTMTGVITPVLTGLLGAFFWRTSRDPFRQDGVTPFHAGVALPLIAALTGQRVFLSFALGWLATPCQAIVHELSEQPPTLPELHDLTDELGHTTWFPLLLVERVWERFFMKPADVPGAMAVTVDGTN